MASISFYSYTECNLVKTSKAQYRDPHTHQQATLKTFRACDFTVGVFYLCPAVVTFAFKEQLNRFLYHFEKYEMTYIFITFKFVYLCVVKFPIRTTVTVHQVLLRCSLFVLFVLGVTFICKQHTLATSQISRRYVFCCTTSEITSVTVYSGSHDNSVMCCLSPQKPPLT